MHLEEEVASHKLSLGLYYQLESIGYGLKELTLLKNTVVEISAGISKMKPDVALKKFLKDIEEQYDRKLGFEQKIREMDGLLLKSKQEHHRISLEYTRIKDVHDKLTELLAYGVTQKDIIHWAHILKINKIDTSVLGTDLLEYGSVKASYNEIFTKLQSLKSEADAMKEKIEDLRKMEDRISYLIGFEGQEAQKAIQALVEDAQHQISNAVSSYIQKIKNIEQQSLLTGQEAMTIVQSLNVKVKGQFDLIDKIGSLVEFSPLIKAARGRQVDADELKYSVVRALDIMISRLDNITNALTMDKLQQAKTSLQSESLFFS
jgi:hypothetical protein